MTDVQQRAAAKHFAEYWQGKGYEKGESQKFWLSLLSDVFGVEHAAEYISFEDQVHLDHTSFIDGFIPSTKVLIEQKSLGKSLTAPIQQSDGSFLSPLQQAQRYVHALLDTKGRQAVPRWVVTCNFEEFRVYDLDHPQNEAQVIKLADLPKEYYRLKFLVDTGDENLKRELELSLKAGELVGIIHDRFQEQYTDPMAKHTQRSLNILCVRLVFCLYAEDAGLFGAADAFSRYIGQYDPKDIRRALIDLFKVLDTQPEERDPYLDDELAAFPYVNGGLFADENIIIPKITEGIKQAILESAHFDWAEISPTIFGAVFESTLNPETRRSGGMHYTSIENIHKVIDPLFLDDLKAELAAIKAEPILRTKKLKLQQYQDKLASLTWLDPAAGSGNFLTETYRCIRRLENEVISELSGGQIVMGDVQNPVKVSIDQLYGIEINDFACTVAKTALWIAESQMLQETENIVHMQLDFLPLKTNANIVEGNALRMDWRKVAPVSSNLRIMGNPPFVGYGLQSEAQKEDILSIYVDEKGKPFKTAGKIDYVAGWYYKAAKLIQDTDIKVAFVSTNSITQGEQVASVWKPLYDMFNVHIDFAYRTFRWDSEANIKAHVHCVIVGFSTVSDAQKRKLYTSDSLQEVDNINAYLINGPDVFIDSRSIPICEVPHMTTGNRPADGGHLIIEADEYDGFVSREPNAKRYIKRLVGAKEYINGLDRYCLWLVGASPAELHNMPLVMQRIEACKQDRLNGAEDRKKLANVPTLFRETLNPDTYVIVPRHSSENRKYIPMGFLDISCIPADSATIIPEAKLFHFGVLMSNVHMAWVRAVCGRIKSDYRYSKDIVYNNFPWPNPTEEQKAKIEQTAQAILNARALYPDSSLADLYDELTMPPELRTAHQNNDRAVMAAYGMSVKDTTESSCVAELMRRYQALVEKKRIQG